jgi:hypothetical protein
MITLDQNALDTAQGYVLGRGVVWLAGIGWSALMTVVGILFFAVILIARGMKELAKPSPPREPPVRMRAGTIFPSEGPMNPTIIDKRK